MAVRQTNSNSRIKLPVSRYQFPAPFFPPVLYHHCLTETFHQGKSSALSSRARQPRVRWFESYIQVDCWLPVWKCVFARACAHSVTVVAASSDAHGEANPPIETKSPPVASVKWSRRGGMEKKQEETPAWGTEKKRERGGVGGGGLTLTLAFPPTDLFRKRQ